MCDSGDESYIFFSSLKYEIREFSDAEHTISKYFIEKLVNNNNWLQWSCMS